ncbi:hypothetical protein C4N9_20875 [Pararhodobacter marinus]|uniref:DUF2184 domain-containing protein n=1 Tax=Pararhodobacter marinus TaxID=2184063 RepID=A0A2U2C4A3_9RHOB|nr:DUF2184 domain-containing protein [Pararhodobacter marinus]PWE26715.1 hypothetical protein C4N9_20875 [Pararhodobacter marinus]
MKHANIDFNDAQQVATGFLMPAYYNVEATVYQTKYQAFDYARYLPVITEGSEWARGVLFRSSDIAGKAEFLSGKGFDMPYADVSRDQHLKGFELAGIGYEWSLEEVQTAALEGRQLGNEKAMAARKVAEKRLWDIALTGATEKNWTGLINDGNVPAADVAANGTGSATFWATKTPDQILADINSAITGIYTETKGTEIADTLLLPSGVMDLLSSTRLTDTGMTTLAFLRQNNAYTARTGQPLLITEMFELNTADPGGDGRAVVYARSPDVLRFHLPMPHKFLPPFQKSSMTWEVAGIMRTGGTEIRLPKAVRYMDGLIDNS